MSSSKKLQIYMGCGGYSNTDWTARGLIYEGVTAEHFLGRYTEHFESVELNSSFYRIPSRRAFAGMLRKTGGHVQFCLKIHESFTHLRNADATQLKRMLDNPQPLREAGVLGPYLAQFPYSFMRNLPNRQYLAQLTKQFAGQQLALEFRHNSWDIPEVHNSLRQLGLIWVTPDYPPLEGLPKPLLRTTHQTAYLRLHGRNTHLWWEGKSAAQRHDYCYPTAELDDWAAQIAQLVPVSEVQTLYIFWQNTTKGHALANAPILRQALEQRGLRALRPKLPLAAKGDGGLFQD